MLLVNFAHCLERPTGITSYSWSLVPSLNQLQPHYLSALPLPGEAEQGRVVVPKDMTAANGFRGHLKRLWWTQTQLPKIMQESGATLVFCPLPEAPRGQDIPVVVTMHDLIPLRFSRPWSPTRLYYRHYLPGILKEARHLICNSQTTADDVMRAYGCSSKKLTVIPLAYDESRFHFLDLPRGHYFLCLGRSAPHKNWQRILAAFAQLPQRHQYELWLAGPTDDRFTPMLLNQAKELGIANQIKVLDFLDSDLLVKVLNQAIALVFPSLWEGFGLPILEAMACGTPVITSNSLPMAEVAGDAALLVDPTEVESIARAMKDLVIDADLHQHLRTAGFANLQRFSARQMGAATVEVLQRYL